MGKNFDLYNVGRKGEVTGFDPIEVLLDMKRLKDCSYKDLSEGTGFSETYWKRVFHYDLMPSDDAKVKICLFFKINPFEVFRK